MAIYECLDCSHQGEFLYRKGKSTLCLQCESPNIISPQTGRDARSFDPILIHQSLTNPNDFSFPGHNADPCPEGYRPITITNLREGDQWTKRINEIESEKANNNRRAQREHFDQRKAQTRADTFEKIKHNPRSVALFKALKERSDQRREKKYAGRIDSKFNINVLSFDASNRSAYADERTGWKDRKS